MKNNRIKTKDLILCAMFAALIAAGAFIKIPIPVIPFTLQTLFVILAGMLLGGRFGAISAAAYMMIGLIGFPVFTEGGGFGYILRPTFGYIVGFIAGAYITGKIVHNVPNPSIKRLIGAAFAGIGVIYFIGMIYFYLIKNLYLDAGMSVGSLFFYCFLMVAPGDIIICFFSAFLAKRILPFMKKHQ
ncbi:MAG: biotin transporter BioY [Oscillospiraceae bacterium]